MYAGESVIDLRTLAERLDYLSFSDITETIDDDERAELDNLRTLENDLQRYFGHSMQDQGNLYEPTFIRDDYFVEWVKEYAGEIGAIDGDEKWPLNHIDWDSAADELRPDYDEFNYAGYTYMLRA